MANFYFTYGDNPQFPYKNGWTLIIADNMETAIKAFRLAHPDVHENTINCAFYYNEEEFNNTILPDNGNDGSFCHETIYADRFLTYADRSYDYTQCNCKHGTVDVFVKDIGIINIPMASAANIGLEAERIYHRLDLTDYFENNNNFNDAILLDTKLIDKLTDHYHQLRMENDGGDGDTPMNFRECIDETLRIFENEILKYKLQIGETIIIESQDESLATHTITNISCVDGKVYITDQNNDLFEIGDIEFRKIKDKAYEVALYVGEKNYD